MKKLIVSMMVALFISFGVSNIAMACEEEIHDPQLEQRIVELKKQIAENTKKNEETAKKKQIIQKYKLIKVKGKTVYKRTLMNQ